MSKEAIPCILIIILTALICCMILITFSLVTIENYVEVIVEQEQTIIELITAINSKVPSKYNQYIMVMCDIYEVDPNIIANMIYEESRFNPNAINNNRNGTSDKGIAQINSRYLKYFADYYDMELDPFNEWQSIEFMVKHMARLINKYGNVGLAVAAYNCGETAVSNNKIPKSTIRYVTRVLE